MEDQVVKIGYMRERVSGPVLAEQEALLRQAGIVDFSRDAPVYTDKHRRGLTGTTPERDKLIRSPRPGNVVVIARASRLGTSRSDVLAVLAEITRRGGARRRGRRGCAAAPDALRAIAFADRAESGAKREQLARMRFVRLNSARSAAGRRS
jgi:uncharacterized phage protein gp47/JayE